MGFFSGLARDIGFMARIFRTLRRVRGVSLDGPDTVPDLVERWAATTPDALAIQFEGRHITYRELNESANRYANWAMDLGIKRGEVVALLMENRPEFLFAWIGMAKFGAVTALINSNLTGQPLAHSLRISEARHIILGAELAEHYHGINGGLEIEPQVWATGGTVEGAADLDKALAAVSSQPVDASSRIGMKTRDNLFYIYTSGTTGNPKAANFSHYRFFQMAYAFCEMSGARPSDRMYVVLPLYHSAGGACAVGQMFAVGGSIILRRRFSASAFWPDVQACKVTLFQYIGELCRYLLTAPPSADEHNHTIRLMIGNGLRPDIWQSFVDRFHIPKIVEFYGATEGNVAMFNPDGKVGAVGRIPRYLDKVFRIKLVKFDVEGEAPLRNSEGFCIESDDGEQGEAIGRIPTDPKMGLGRFEGYKGAEETNKKILRNVFETGDAWFRSGDLLKRDAEGYFYFVDRIGDTFRWKGENVATSEVAEVLSVFPGIKEANVYGVKVPGTDGRAGMAAIVGENLDLLGLAAHVKASLPSYAVPLFLRLRAEIEITGTFKHRKVDYVREGFDPASVPEPLYFLDPDLGAYVALTSTLHDRICSGAIKL
jgi:fatty-acyl-CoA synthase